MLLSALVVIAIVIASGCAVTTVVDNHRRFSPEDARNSIRRNLPIGATEADVTAYLDARGAEHTPIEHEHVADSSAGAHSTERYTIFARFRNVCPHLIPNFVTCDTTVTFYLDSDRGLVDFFAREQFTGP